MKKKPFIVILFLLLSVRIFAQTNITMSSSSSYTVCSANFYDGGGAFNAYPPNQNVVVTVYPATIGEKISVTFNSFKTYYGGVQDQDVLYIYNGNNTLAPLIGILSGQNGYGTIISTANDGSLTFQFISNQYSVPSLEEGWNATISCTPITITDVTMLASSSFTTCGGNFYDGGGPNGSYMANQSVVTTLYPICSSSKISVSFSSFSTYYGNQQDQDVLYIYDGSTIFAPIKATLAGNINPGTITSTASDGSLTFQFIANQYSVASIEAGWEATISCNPTIPTITQNGNSLYSSSGLSYQWYLNGNVISGATSQIYIPNQNGNYTVVVTDSSGCSTTSLPLSFTSTDIDYLKEDNLFSIYPNPNTGIFTIAFDKYIAAEIKIFNGLGELIYKDVSAKPFVKKEIHLEDISNGVYFLQMIINDLTVNKRVIILR